MKHCKIFILIFFIFIANILTSADSGIIEKKNKSEISGDYVAIGWNDLGMHCMNLNYDTLCVLPPFNNIWIQVINRGMPPSLVSQNVKLSYSFPANSYSVGKVNFWSFSNPLFGVILPDNIGLTGHGLTGEMEWNGTSFETTGIPITPFDDANTKIEQPYQIVEVILKDNNDSLLDKTSFVVPTSTEMHCDTCHGGGGRTVDENILRKHDGEEDTQLLASKPVLCAKCHASNALGTTGDPEIPPLSEAMHDKHSSIGSNCYNCHPGNQTQCLRGVMFLKGKTCVDCHGNMKQVAESIKNGRRPWIDEPKCATCHPDHAENTNKLYRNSIGHGNLYCTACHNSPHAELPTSQTRDSIQVQRLQGNSSYIKNCLICHTSQPLDAGPHNTITSWRIAQHLLGIYPLTGLNFQYADYNKNATIDIGDYIYQLNRGL